MDWYGPTDQWPRHGEQHFRDALKHAREAEWWFVKYEDHSFGRVVCDPELPKDARCEYLVLSTGKASEGPARTLSSLVDRCPHRETSVAPSGVVLAGNFLDEADLLIDAAQACMDALGKRSRIDELLELAAQQVAAAEAVLDEAIELEADASQDRTRAGALADAAGYPTSAPTEAEPLLDAAEERTVAAERILRKPGRSQARVKARERASLVHQRIRSIRGQMPTWM